MNCPKGKPMIFLPLWPPKYLIACDPPVHNNRRSGPMEELELLRTICDRSGKSADLVRVDRHTELKAYLEILRELNSPLTTTTLQRKSQGHYQTTAANKMSHITTYRDKCGKREGTKDKSQLIS